MLTYKEFIELILGFCALGSIIYKVAQIEKAIYLAIDVVRDDLLIQQKDIEKRLDIHLQDYLNRTEMINYIIGGMNEKMDHKFNRLYSSMRDIEKYLQQKNQDFRVREYFGNESTGYPRKQ